MKSAADPRPDRGLELWLLRHGATEWARNGRHTGRTDLPLLAEGEDEARSLAPLLQGLAFTAVATSPLQRARRTCELAGLGAAAQIWDDLHEWDYGAYEGITTAEIHRSQSDWTIWSHGCPAGEDGAAVQIRCERVIARALALALALAGEPPQRCPPNAAAGSWLHTSDSPASSSSMDSSSAPLQVREPLANSEGPCRIALFAHGHLLRSLAATWLGLGAQGGALLVLGTGGIGVLGYERQQRALLRWNLTAAGERRTLQNGPSVGVRP